MWGCYIPSLMMFLSLWESRWRVLGNEGISFNVFVRPEKFQFMEKR